MDSMHGSNDFPMSLPGTVIGRLARCTLRSLQLLCCVDNLCRQKKRYGGGQHVGIFSGQGHMELLQHLQGGNGDAPHRSFTDSLS